MSRKFILGNIHTGSGHNNFHQLAAVWNVGSNGPRYQLSNQSITHCHLRVLRCWLEYLFIIDFLALWILAHVQIYVTTSTCRILKHSITQRMPSCHFFIITPSTTCTPWRSHYLLFFPIILSFENITWIELYSIYNLLKLPSFSQHNLFEIQPGCG